MLLPCSVSIYQSIAIEAKFLWIVNSGDSEKKRKRRVTERIGEEREKAFLFFQFCYKKTKQKKTLKVREIYLQNRNKRHRFGDLKVISFRSSLVNFGHEARSDSLWSWIFQTISKVSNLVIMTGDFRSIPFQKFHNFFVYVTVNPWKSSNLIPIDLDFL